MQLDDAKQVIVAALEEVKAVDLKILDVRGISSFTDLMIIASGTSTRHVKALSDKVIENSKKSGLRPLGIEGERDAEWVLVDFGDIVVHVMHPQTRDFYNLEKLWSMGERNNTGFMAG